MNDESESNVLVVLRPNPIPMSGKLGRLVGYVLLFILIIMLFWVILKRTQYLALEGNIVFYLVWIGAMTAFGCLLGLLLSQKYMVSPIILRENEILYPTTIIDRLLGKNRVIPLKDVEKICWKTSSSSGYFGKILPKENFIFTKHNKKYWSHQRHPDDVDRFIEIIKERWPHIQVEEIKR